MISVCACVCMYVCMYVYAYICMGGVLSWRKMGERLVGAYW